jgi:hypothetical protein
MNASIAMPLPIEIDQRVTKLDAELRAVNDLAERYYRNMREATKLHPLELMRLLHDGAVLGGVLGAMPDDQVAFDQVRATAPKRERSTMDDWYTSGGSAAQKAKRRGVARATLYLHWKSALGYFRGRLHEKGIKV